MSSDDENNVAGAAFVISMLVCAIMIAIYHFLIAK
jgi:hypothetical protein